MNSDAQQILLVEDSSSDAAIIQRCLQEGETCIGKFQHVTCIADAIQSLRQESYDIVLLDLSLPDSSGVDSIHAIRATNACLPVVVLTGLDDDVVAIDSLRNGAQDYLSKQRINPSMLARVIRYSIERHQLSMELASANQRLHQLHLESESASRAKSEFLANMSHEIRTPMTSILGFTEILIEQFSTISQRDGLDALQIIQRNGVYLLNLINDILDLSKIESGNMETERIVLATEHVAHEVFELMQVRSNAKGLPLRIDIAPDVPKQIKSDPTRLRQVLVNLMGNAIKFTELGEVVLRVRCGQLASGAESVRFEVVDTGIGMTGDQLARLFQPFTQADTSTTRKFGGTGLGLTISKRLAEILDGELSVESQPNQGSTFAINIPAPVSASAQLPNQAIGGKVQETNDSVEPSTTKSNAADLTGVRLLLAEDGPDNQRLIAFLLRKAGAEVTVVENGQLAVDAVVGAEDKSSDETRLPANFDVILMDMQMPVMDGYEATRQLRQQGFDGPIIALTALAMSGDRAKCLEAGCDDYATKPIDRTHFFQTVQQHLHGQPATGH